METGEWMKVQVICVGRRWINLRTMIHHTKAEQALHWGITIATISNGGGTGTCSGGGENQLFVTGATTTTMEGQL